tara:strand:+ start:362 stop:973 length:612 start_codon:yes stop_codon:yes gene_type:complete
MPYNIYKGKVIPKQPFEMQNLFYKFDFHIDKDYILDYRKKHISEYTSYALLTKRTIYGLKVNNVDYFEELERKFLNDFNLKEHDITFDKGLMHYPRGGRIDPHLDRPYSHSTCVIMFPIQVSTPMKFHEYVGDEEDMDIVHRQSLLLNNIGMELAVPLDRPTVVNTDFFHSAKSDKKFRILMKWNVKFLEFYDLIKIMKGNDA